VIVLDTNVISEALRPVPSPAVLRWLAAQDAATVYTSAITEAEILYGIEILPSGKRRTLLFTAVEKIFGEVFHERVLPFNEEAAAAFAKIAARRVAAGRPISQMDAMIAAIVRCQGATLATRNTADFGGCGITIRNPWADGPL
jgi:predicted nucleic acid-binding protein